MTGRTIRWGILGTARIATKLGRAIRSVAGAELAAIASRSADKARRWIEEQIPVAEQAGVAAHGSYQELLDDPTIEVVYIPLPPALHAEWTIRAAERGKHVLCEKPLARTAGEAREMVAACERHGVQLMDGVMWPHHPRAAAMLQPIRSGMLGELRRVTAAFTFCWPWLRNDAEPSQIPPDEFRLSRNLGGGSLLDLGWYCVGAALWAFGEEPRRAFATARWRNDIDLSCSATLWFGDGRMASFDCGFDTGMRRWLEVAGSQGSLVCDDFTRPWKEERPRFWLHDASGKAGEFVSPGVNQETCLVETLTRLVQTGHRDPRWPRFSLQTQKACDALEQSARQEKIVEIA